MVLCGVVLVRKKSAGDSSPPPMCEYTTESCMFYLRASRMQTSGRMVGVQLLLVLCCTVGVFAGNAAATKPNFVIMLMDDVSLFDFLLKNFRTKDHSRIEQSNGH